MMSTYLSLLVSIIGIIITIFFVVGTHEFAHFIVARWLKVKVLCFSIGFGKTLVRWHDRKGTEYRLALIPLGGYVKMLDETEAPVKAEESQFAFNRQALYTKFLIVAAGPCMNLFCAFVLYCVIFMVGFTAIKPVIGNVAANSIAAVSGLTSNEEILRVDGSEAMTWTSVMLRLLLHLGNQDVASIEVRNMATMHTSTHSLNLSHWQLNKLNPDPLASIGITPSILPIPYIKVPPYLLKKIQYGPMKAIAKAGQEVQDFIYFNAILFGKLITGKLSLESLGGPITIFEGAGSALQYGLLPFMGFLAFLSISIGIINFLPIPGLDGGHLFIYVIESIIGRPIPEKILLLLYRFGFILIFLLVIQAVFNDLLRLF